MRLRSVRVLGLALLLAAALPIRADDAAEPGNRVSFRVEASRDVENDRIEVVLASTAEHAEASQASDQVNRAMQWALERARDTEGVEVRTGGYTTQPVHAEGRIRRWRASQELVLRGQDADVITDLLGKLQSKLVLRSFRFHVSDARRRDVEDALIDEALGAYRARAERVRRSLGASSWQLDQVSIESGRPPHPGPRPMMRSLAAAEGVAAPGVEAGTSRIQVWVAGSIVLE
jgi:predicted secreted protein